MNKIIFIILSIILLTSCSSNNLSKNLNIQSAELTHSKFTNMNNNFSYQEYQSLIVEYGKNSKFPEIK